MKKIIWSIGASLLCLFLLCPISARAEGDPNIDGGGGGMGNGTAENKWSVNDEGVRVTVIDAITGEAVSKSIDISNANVSDIVVHFGKVSKASYIRGATLKVEGGSYQKITPEVPLPKIIPSESQPASIEAIKNHFTDEQVLRGIAKHIGMNFDTMINGSYKLMIEPIAYVTFEGTRTAFTATEAALYNGATGGLVRKRLTRLSHKNLPLSLFLERDDAGYQAWTGSRTEKVNDADIIAYLGMGIVRFTDEPSITPPVYEQPPDYTYRTDTDVITSVTISGGYSNPYHAASVRFRILGVDYWVSNVYYPQDGQQLAWVKWHTPSTPQRIEIEVYTDRSASKTKIICDIEKLVENPPPNPVADDVNPGFTIPAPLSGYNATHYSWTVWSCPWHPDLRWHENMVWIKEDHTKSCKKKCKINHGHWEDQGWWVDYGWWEYKLNYYYASLSTTVNLEPDQTSPTDYGDTTKSGYGVCIGILSSASSSQGAGAVTQPQTFITYFPEFHYGSYWRFLEYLGGYYTFKVNPYSTYNHRVHFTPIWFPDGQYTPYTLVMDAWTPVGMMGQGVSDSVTISGNLWSDWHIAPDNPD